jgi:tRNA uridine 5-carbamoylmethylation protein Kti12
VSGSENAPVLIVTGPPGVGKTTAAEIVADRSSPSVHLESDVFFRFVRAGYVEPWAPESHEQNGVVFEAVAAAAVRYSAAGYFTIVDGIVIPGWFLEPLRDALEDAGLRVSYAVLREPLAVCIARAGDREGEGLVDPEVIERLWRNFTDLAELERHAVDLGGKSPEETADLLEQKLGDGLLAV